MIAHIAFDLTAFAIIYFDYETAFAHFSSNDARRIPACS